MKDREIEISYKNTIRVGDKEIGVLRKMRGIVGFDIRPDDVDYSYMNDFLHGVITDIINPGFYWIGISGRKYKIALPFEEETYDLMI